MSPTDRPDPAPSEAEELARRADPIAPSTGPGGPADSASGGYGSASADRSSGGSAEGAAVETPAGEDPQTDWLRTAPGDGDEGEPA